MANVTGFERIKSFEPRPIESDGDGRWVEYFFERLLAYWLEQMNPRDVNELIYIVHPWGQASS